MVMAAGPFTTSDNLEMEPLQQLMRIVVTERPDVLILVCVCVCVCVVCVCVQCVCAYVFVYVCTGVYVCVLVKHVMNSSVLA